MWFLIECDILFLLRKYIMIGVKCFIYSLDIMINFNNVLIFIHVFFRFIKGHIIFGFEEIHYFFRFKIYF